MRECASCASSAAMPSAVSRCLCLGVTDEGRGGEVACAKGRMYIMRQHCSRAFCCELLHAFGNKHVSGSIWGICMCHGRNVQHV
eukprot:scaffold3233_cov13-Tisochrysis_lutea.AAC.1